MFRRATTNPVLARDLAGGAKRSQALTRAARALKAEGWFSIGRRRNMKKFIHAQAAVVVVVALLQIIGQL